MRAHPSRPLRRRAAASATLAAIAASTSACSLRSAAASSSARASSILRRASPRVLPRIAIASATVGAGGGVVGQWRAVCPAWPHLLHGEARDEALFTPARTAARREPHLRQPSPRPLDHAA